MKCAREVMEILEAYDLTRCAHSAALLVGCDEKTVTRYVAVRDAGRDVGEWERRSRMIDPFLSKIEELVEASQGRIRADVVHEKLTAMGFSGTDRTTRRAVAEAKTAYRDGHRRKYRPWIPEPGMWLQFDWGEGPRVGGRRTQLFCAWLSWSRFRVVVPAWDQQLPTLIACLDTTLRRIGGAPTYLLTDNPRTVTIDRIAGLAVRHPDVVSAARHYGCGVRTCEPFDPESKGGAEHTVKIAKADLVPTETNLVADYDSFADLEAACGAWCERVNARPHRATGQPPVERLMREGPRLHVLPDNPHLLALGEERLVGTDQTVSWGNVRYSTPDGHQGRRVWCRVSGDELVIVACTGCGPRRDRAAPALHARQSQDCRRALPAPPRRRVGAADAQTAAPHRSRDRLPHAGRGSQPVADRGRGHRRRADPAQDEPGRRAGARPGRRAGRYGAGGRRAGRTVRRRRPGVDPRPPHRRQHRNVECGGDQRNPFRATGNRPVAQVGRMSSRNDAPPIPEELAKICTRMRLPYLRKAAPDVLATARAQRWDPAEVVRVLLHEEVVGRDAATRRMRRKTANFPTGKTFSSWRPEESSIPEATQNALMTLEWVHRRENLALSGASGYWEEPLRRSLSTRGDRSRPASRVVHPRIPHRHHR